MIQPATIKKIVLGLLVTGLLAASNAVKDKQVKSIQFWIKAHQVAKCVLTMMAIQWAKAVNCQNVKSAKAIGQSGQNVIQKVEIVELEFSSETL